jgi:hypothetical protein
MIHFPAPFTLCSVTSLIGAVLTAAFQVVTAGRFSPGTPQISFEIILSLVLVVMPTREVSFPFARSALFPSPFDEMSGCIVAGWAGELGVHHVPDVGAREERAGDGLHVQPDADRRFGNLLRALPRAGHAARKVYYIGRAYRFIHTYMACIG